MARPLTGALPLQILLRNTSESHFVLYIINVVRTLEVFAVFESCSLKNWQFSKFGSCFRNPQRGSALQQRPYKGPLLPVDLCSFLEKPTVGLPTS